VQKLRLIGLFVLGVAVGAAFYIRRWGPIWPSIDMDQLCWYFPATLPVRVTGRSLGVPQEYALRAFGRHVAQGSWEVSERDLRQAVHVARIVVMGAMKHESIGRYLQDLPPAARGSLTSVQLLNAPEGGSSLRYWLVPGEHAFDIEFDEKGRAILVVVAGYYHIAGQDNASLLLDGSETAEASAVTETAGKP